jgi:putative oxidoreductase
MNLVQRVEHWGDAHHPQWLDLIRIALGAFLCYKGVDFLMNMGTMLDLITNRMSFGSFTSMLMSNYIAFAQILGGILLILGALTRFACLIRSPFCWVRSFSSTVTSTDLFRQWPCLLWYCCC